MKIGIVTLYGSFNCGSFLQAYAMSEYLKREGHNVVFLKNKKLKSSSLFLRLCRSVKYGLQGKKDKVKHLFAVHNSFTKAYSKLSCVKITKNLDLIIYGSDTIWNYYQSPYLMSNWKRFWGADFNGKKISYAVSIGSSKIENLLGKEFLVNQVNEFSSLGVRDDNSFDFVRMALKKEKTIEKVIDPTMLLEKSFYENLAQDIELRGYVLFYYFGGISENIKKQVKEFAQKNNKKIVVFGEKLGWADKYVSFDPFLMLSYFKNADFVITNTFHGNIFSLIFNKQYISFGKEKEKIVSLLSQFGANDRLVGTDETFLQLFAQEIDYKKINDKIFIEREKAKDFIVSALTD